MESQSHNHFHGGHIYLKKECGIKTFMNFSKVIIFIPFLFCFGFGDGATRALSSDRGGQWQLLLHNTGVVGMHMALTHRNTVIMFDQTGAGRSNYRLRRRFNSSRKCTESENDILDSTCYAHSVEYHIDGNKLRPLKLESDPWCSSGSFLSNGTLLQFGGYGVGAKRIRMFKPCSDHHCDWTQPRKSLSDQRWYASAQILPGSDRAVVVGGRDTFSYEFVPKIESGEKSFALPFLRRTYNRNSRGNNLYPFLHLSSDGNLFIFANRDSILYNLRRHKVIKTFPRIPGNGSRNYPSSGSSVILPLHHTDNFQKVEVLICGGAASGAYRAAENGRFLMGLRSCGRMEITGNKNVWKMENMPGPRLLHDMLILPTGHILIINGAKRGSAGYDKARNASHEPYLYAPRRKIGTRFTVLSSTKIARMDHSTATLLPDGRVLVAGGNPHSKYTFHNVAYPTEMRLQAFFPNYMHRRYYQWRPRNVSISYGGGGGGESYEVGYGKQFSVRFFLGRKPSKEMEFSVYSPPFTTHSFSMNQRLLKLRCVTMERNESGWISAVVEAPPSPNVAPSGYYLFTVVNSGIPCVSLWVRFIHA